MAKIKAELIKDLTPIYKFGNEFLVSLKTDIPLDGSIIEDCLILKINSDGTYSKKPWSGQKMLKFVGGYYKPVSTEERDETLKALLLYRFSNSAIEEILQLLQNPPEDSIQSLIYIPERLKNKPIENQNKINNLIKKYIEIYNEYLENAIDNADFINYEKQILEYYNISQTKNLNKHLYHFVEESCDKKKVQYSDKIADQIIIVLEKIKKANEYKSKMDLLFLDVFEKLKLSPKVLKEELPNKPGIYVFYKGDEAIYVGRTDNIKKRVQHHVRTSSQNGSATFAFNLAKKDYERVFEVTLKTRRNTKQKDTQGIIWTTRKDLEKREDFKPFFDARKDYLTDCKFRFIKEENDLLQAMLEPYIAYKLDTYPINNTFDNH